MGSRRMPMSVCSGLVPAALFSGLVAGSRRVGSGGCVEIPDRGERWFLTSDFLRKLMEGSSRPVAYLKGDSSERCADG